MGMWGAAAKRHASSNGGKYLKLKEDGAHVRLMVMDSPCVRVQHWTDVDGKRAAIACKGDDCPACKAGEDKSTSFPVCIYNLDEKKVQILTMSPGLFKAFASEVEHESRGKTKNQVFSVRREGLMLNTSWTVRHKGDAKQEEIDAAEGEDLYDPVEEDESGSTSYIEDEPQGEQKKAAAAPVADDDVPF